ncbi:MAG TPA: S9 family peptidase, partial [Thermoanaerobaculia bacterium]
MRLRTSILALISVLVAVAGSAEPAGSGYDKPPQNVLDVLHAPAPPNPFVSPTRDRILLVSWVRFPPIGQVAEPFLRLAGVRVEPRTRRKHDTPGGYGIAPCAQTLTLVEVSNSREVPVTVPAGGCADGFAWSADGRRFAFRNTSKDAVELWIGDAATGAVRRLGGARLNPMLGSSVQWMPDQKTLLVKLVPASAGAPPAATVESEGPSIQETTGQSGESSTYETRDTLSSKHDEDLFDYYAASQLALVDADSGQVQTLGDPAIITGVDASPDGEHLLVELIRKPYSYVTTYPNFAHDVELWDRAGRKTRTLARLPLADRVPIAGVPTGPRDFEWRPTEPATLVWAEALDGGDWNVSVPARDKVLMQSAPFSDAPVEIARVEQRFAGFDWSERSGVALLQEYNENKHWRRTFLVDLGRPASKPSLVWDLSSDERYNDPGRPVYRTLPNGQRAVRLDGDGIFLDGKGASIEGDRPFLDRFDLKSRKAERLFRSDRTVLESFLAFTGPTDRV